ncbi:MAG TPA: Ig-like domain-containing protein [Longimicrobiales bacterium]|nr:Ig-like domain-containing protein [Longimicrobiales bacterium]
MRRLCAACVVFACSSPTDAPPSNAPASVSIAPATALLVSVSDTVQLDAVVRNRRSEPVTASVTWSASPQAIVSVDADGTVIALGNGTATVRAAAGSVSGTMTVRVEQAVDSVEIAGDEQGGGVAAALDSMVVVVLRDARGHPVVGAPASFTVVSGGGTVDPATTQTDASGTASATWTLGEMGPQELDVQAGFNDEASHRFTASALPLEPASMAVLNGDGQSELVGMALPQPLQVLVLDAEGNVVPDVLVVFSVDGDAALDAAEVYTNLDGVAAVHVTLGSAPGTYAVHATVPDSLVRSGEPLDGSPVIMTADAVTFSLDAPSALVAMDTVTITGTGFHPTLESNVVHVGGAAATIIDGTQSALTIEVPTLGCTPQRVVEVEVLRAGGQGVQSVTWTPAGALDLDVGERRILTDADEQCLQFLPGADDEYLVGLSTTAQLDARSTFSMVGVDANGPFGDAMTANDWTSRRAGIVNTSASSRAVSSDPELRLRAYEETLVRGLHGSAGSTRRSEPGPSVPASAPPVVGQDLQLRVPDLRADPCVDFLPVTARVFSVGARLVLASAAPLPDPATPAYAALVAAANALHVAYGDAGVDMIANFLSAGGWDPETRVTVVLTPNVALMELPAFASVVDQLPRSSCASSNEGFYVYVAVPDAPSAAELMAMLEDVPPEATHHIAHIVQWAQRLARGGGLLPLWIAEGQAELLVEHVGLRLAGFGSQQELGAAVLGTPGLSDWIQDRFDQLARFTGWDGAAGKTDGAPEGCSLFGFASPDSPCDPSAAPGAAWSFLRYVSDRFGVAQPGGQSALHSAILTMDPTADLLAQLEALLGIEVPELIVDWAATLYTDGRLATASAPSLQLTSWRLDELLPDDPRQLTPEQLDFAGFTRSGMIVGGGTAYSLITSTGSHGSLAVSVGDGAGGAIADALRPRVWVVRMR